MTRVEDSAFTCSMCLDIFEEPMECENCHNNYCKKCCIRIIKCPLCMTEPLKVRANISLKRIILDIKFSCPNNCGKSFTKIELPHHIKQCQMPLVYCSLCPYNGIKEKFWVHITEDHKEEIINAFTRQNVPLALNNNSQQLTQSQLSIDNNSVLMQRMSPYPNPNQNMSSIPIQNPRLSCIDSNNNLNLNQTQILPQNNNYNINQNLNYRSQLNLNVTDINAIPQNETQKRFLGSNGIYYCYQPSNLDCGCCNGVCAEGNCLCKLCMNLNTKLKRLNRGDLINKAGKVSRYSMNSYYCGERYLDQKKNVVGFVFQQEVYCNYPNDPCQSCKCLNIIVKKYL